MSDWKLSMMTALSAGGCASQTEWVTRYPGVHCWFQYDGHPSCAMCGAMQRRDGRNKPCRGIVTIGLR